jgi:hypothetical protein
MANVKVKDADASDKYLKATGAGSDLDPHVVEHLDSNSAAMLSALQAIQTAVELIDNMISGSEAQVDILSSVLPTGAATEATLAAIQTAVELIDNMISGSEAQVDIVSSVLPTGAATETTLAAIQTAVEAIQTATETIDDMISGSEAQVDVVTSALPTGAATETTLASIKTAVELIDNVVSGSEAQVDVVAPLPAGTNQIGDVVINDIEDGAATSAMDTGNHALRVNVVAGSGSGVSHTDDAAFSSGSDDVVPAAGVYQSSPDQVDDGDAGAVRMTQKRVLLVSHETPAGDSMVDDTNDALKVNVVAGSGSGVSHTDDAAFTAGSDDVVPAAGFYNDSSPDQVDEGDAGSLRMSSRRELYAQIRDAAGNERGLNVDASGNIGVTDAGSTLSVDGTVTADAGTGPWPVTDNDGSLTVDGSVTATQGTHDNLNANANLQVADTDVANGNPVPVSDAGGTLTVDGTVTADAGTGPWPVTDNDGSLTVDDGGSALTVDGTVTADAGTGPWPVTDNGGSLTVDDGDSTISVDDGGGALTVDGTVTADAGTGPWPVTDNGGSLTVDGSVTATLSPATSGGLSVFRSIDLDESEEAVKASAGMVYGWFLYNLATATRYIKFYNDTVANVVVGTDTPVLTIPLDADQGTNVSFEHGIAFSTAITVAATTGVLDNDTGAPGNNEVIAHVFYK